MTVPPVYILKPCMYVKLIQDWCMGAFRSPCKHTTVQIPEFLNILIFSCITPNPKCFNSCLYLDYPCIYKKGQCKNYILQKQRFVYVLRFATQPAIMMTKLLGIKWELRGAKNLLKDEAAVIAMTHQSMLDILGKW